MIKTLNIYKKEILLISFLIIVINIILMKIYSVFVDINVCIYKITVKTFLISGFFVPFFEETLIRGIFQKMLIEKTKLSLKIIYIVVASIFSILHMKVFFIPYFVTSLLLSYVFQETNELIVPIVCHINYNLFVLILMILNV